MEPNTIEQPRQQRPRRESKATALRRRITAAFSCLLLVVSQLLGIITACSPAAENALATDIGSDAVIESDHDISAQGKYFNGFSHHYDKESGETLLCIEAGFDGADGDAHVTELVGATTRCTDAEYHQGFVYMTWSQQNVTDCALIQKYANENYGDDNALIVAQCYTWAYERAQGNLDDMLSWLGYVPVAFQEVGGDIVAYVKGARGGWTGHGKLYSKTGERQQLARFWVEQLNGGLELHKSSSKPKVTTGNGCYSLKGTEYGLYSDEDCKHLVRTLRCDASGNASASELAYGTYYLREDKAAPGYALDEQVRAVEVPAGAVKTVEVSDEPQACTVDVAVLKVDAESKGSDGEEGSSMAGAEFRIDYYAGFYDLDDLPKSATKTYTVTTGDDGAAHLKRDLPLGTVVIRETKAPTGYVLDSTPRLVKITSAGESAKVDTYNAPTVGNHPVRGDLTFVKADEETQRRMAGVAFKLTSKKTGESHVLVTDENGCFDSTDPAHSNNTNAADAALAADGKSVDSSKLKVCGIWFGAGKADDSRGALPYGTYELEELRCDANAGHRLVSTTVTVSRDGKKYSLGTFNDVQPAIATTLAYANGEKTCPAAEVELIDAVRYEGLERGHEYRLEGELHDFDENGNDVGVVSRAEVAFSPQLATGEQSVAFTVDASKLGGHRLVAYERVYDGDDLLSEHADASDEAQTVRIPRIATELTGDAGHEADATSSTLILTDTVTYENLEASRVYTVSGTLHLKNADGTDAGPALDDAGAEIRAAAEFTPEASSGTVELVFEFPGVNLAGRDVVAFEEVSRDSIAYAVHADISDESQTVTFPALSTTARGNQTRDHDIAAMKDQKVIDAVKVRNVEPGAEYELRGSLHLVDSDGNDGGVIAEKRQTFTPSEKDGSVELEFDIDASDLAGRTLVAFEELYRGGVRVGSHADLSDEGQSIHVPQIETTLRDANEAKRTVVTSDSMTIDLYDNVSYKNLIVGKEYQLKGTLHLKGANGADSGVLAGTDGKAVEATATFTPSAANGEALVMFRFDAGKLAGKTVVAFEELYSNEVELAAHADINDEAQAFFFQEKPPAEAPPAEEPPAKTSSGAKLPTTGDVALPIFACIVLGGLLALCAWAISRAGSMQEANR